MDCLCNGFLVTDLPCVVNNRKYCGIDNNAWPIDICYKNEPLVSCIYESFIRMDDTPFLVDLSTLHAYLSQAATKSVRVLYCEAESTERGNFSQALHDEYGIDSKFLGFDYAWPSGDYYSAILNDLIYREIAQLKNFSPQLNPYGLFQTKRQVDAFSQAREKVIKMVEKDATMAIEGGYFCKFCIFATDL